MYPPKRLRVVTEGEAGRLKRVYVRYRACRALQISYPRVLFVAPTGTMRHDFGDGRGSHLDRY